MESNGKQHEPEVAQYDSLSNFFATDHSYKHLIGQTLLYCGNPYGRIDEWVNYKKGKYYKLLSISGSAINDEYFNGKMDLCDLETNDTIHVKQSYFDNEFKDLNNSWVVLGHYEKLKSMYVDSTFVYNDAHSNSSLINRYEGNLLSIEADTVTEKIRDKSIWKCIDVQVRPRQENDGLQHDDRSPIVLIFENEKYGKHYTYYEDRFKKPAIRNIFTLKSTYENAIAKEKKRKSERMAELTRKYGESNAKMIAAGKVCVGMTKAMCIEAWGRPRHKHETITSSGSTEQWVYGSSYIYFRGDKVIAIQN